MTLRNIGIIFRKEVLDITRDRRAMFAMIVIPIAVVPLLMFGMGKLMAFGTRKLLQEPSRVAIIGAQHGPKVVQTVEALERVETFAMVPPEVMLAQMEQVQKHGMPDMKGAGLTAEDVEKAAFFKVVEPAPADVEAARKAVERKELEAVLVIPDGFEAELDREHPAKITIVYDSSFDKSQTARRKLLDQVLKPYERGVVLLRLPRHNIDKQFIDPIDVVDASVASKEQEGRAVMSFLLPYMLILMCFSGAMYPAIDLGAAEKERGTLETLLLCPAERSEIVLGKLFVIFLTALLAAALNIGTLAFSLGSGLFANVGLKIPMSVDPVGGAVAFVLMLPLAAIFASVLLSISIFAKSFKEAQTYFAPFNVVIILPALFSAIPGVELNLWLSLIPVVNVSLAIKEALQGTYKWDCLGVIVASTMLLAAICVGFCTQWFKREEVLFRS